MDGRRVGVASIDVRVCAVLLHNEHVLTERENAKQGMG